MMTIVSLPFSPHLVRFPRKERITQTDVMHQAYLKSKKRARCFRSALVEQEEVEERGSNDRTGTRFSLTPSVLPFWSVQNSGLPSAGASGTLGTL